MLTAGISPASTVWSSNDSKLLQSTAPSGSNGRRTAEMPKIVRSGRNEGAYASRVSRLVATGPSSSWRVANFSSSSTTSAGMPGTAATSTADASSDAPTAHANQWIPGATAASSAGTTTWGYMTFAFAVSVR